MLSQLEQLFTVRSLTPDIDHIDKDVDVLMLVHPKNLPPKTLYAIDQFVMRGGRVLLFVDPRQRLPTPSGQDPQNPFAGAMANHSSNLEPLLAAWGVDYDPTKVVGDLELGLEVRSSMQAPPTRHIGILGLAPGRHGPEGRRTRPRSIQSMSPRPAFSRLAPAQDHHSSRCCMSSTSAAPIPASRFKR